MSTEINRETETCDDFVTHVWLYVNGDAARYDRDRALFPGGALA